MIYQSLSASILVTLVFILGCTNSPEGDGIDRSVINVADDDPEMVQAIKTAKETFGFFENNWQTMTNDGYSLKFALPTADGELEHIWFSPTKIEGDKITGECANDPANIPGLKIGDSRTVSRDDVTDWMILVGNQCYGGYTIRILAKRNPDAAPPLAFVDHEAN